MRNFIIALLMLPCVSLMAHRESSYYLTGTVGDDEIVMRIDEFGEACYARYFNNENKFDKILEGTILADNTFEMYATKWDSTENKKINLDTIILKEQANFSWNGTWQMPNGIAKSVTLKPIIIDTLNYRFKDVIRNYPINPYTAIRLQDITFKASGKKKYSSGVRINYFTESQTNLTYFYLKESQKYVENTDSINTYLRAQHLKAIDAFYSCTNSGGKGVYTTEFNIHYVSPYVISFTYIIKSSCYGGSLENNTTHLTLSVNTAEKLMLEDFIWFGNDKPDNLRDGSYEWYQYRYHVFGEHILSILKKSYPEYFKEASTCNYNQVKTWQFPEWYLAKEGIYISYGGWKKKECATAWSILPYSKLEGYFTGNYGFVAK